MIADLISTFFSYLIYVRREDKVNKILEILDQIKGYVDEHSYKIIIIITTSCLLLGLILIFKVHQHNGESIPQVSSSYTSASSLASSSQSSAIKSTHISIYVDVKGEVHHPGLYYFKYMPRVDDVIRIAGGFTKEADQSNVNLAKTVSDQDVIIIAKKGKTISDGNSSQVNNSAISNTNSISTNKVSLNSDDINGLQRLDRVGAKKAQKIIDYRNEHHGFKKIDELKNISGFGDKTFERLKDSLQL